MTAGQPARLVTDCQRLATGATESCVPELTFTPRGGLTFDGHERGMAGPSYVCGRKRGGRRET